MDSAASVCWVCLESEGGSDARGPLIAPCACAQRSGRVCHSRCLARCEGCPLWWQLRNAGHRREQVCEWCSGPLPNWRPAMTPSWAAKSLAAAPAIMNVAFGGTSYAFTVQAGEQGLRDFTDAIRRAFSLPPDAQLDISFTCDEPHTGSLLMLQGAGAYDAAVHCASVSAARRLQQDEASSSPTSQPAPLSSSSSSATSSSPSFSTSPQRHLAPFMPTPARRDSTAHEAEQQLADSNSTATSHPLRHDHGTLQPPPRPPGSLRVQQSLHANGGGTAGTGQRTTPPTPSPTPVTAPLPPAPSTPSKGSKLMTNLVQRVRSVLSEVLW